MSVEYDTYLPGGGESYGPMATGEDFVPQGESYGPNVIGEGTTSSGQEAGAAGGGVTTVVPAGAYDGQTVNQEQVDASGKPWWSALIGKDGDINKLGQIGLLAALGGLQNLGKPDQMELLKESAKLRNKEFDHQWNAKLAAAAPGASPNGQLSNTSRKEALIEALAKLNGTPGIAAGDSSLLASQGRGMINQGLLRSVA